MNAHRSLGFSSLVLSSFVLLAACSAESAPESGGGSVERGLAAAQARNCMGCHQADGSGSTMPLQNGVYSSNITPDVATGLGDWTDKQIDDAIRFGIDDADKPMCAPMPVFSQMSAEEAADIIAYLRSLAPVTREVAESACPSQS